MKLTLKNLTNRQKAILVETVCENPYLQHVGHKPFLQQAHFLTYESEELLYGGAAGGGKSDALLMSALQYVHYPNYAALLLRRTYQDLSQPNAIMDRAKKWLQPFVSKGLLHWNNQTKTFTFPTGSTLSFGYLSHDNDLDQYQGSELQFVGFDELTQFTERQYTYLHSRLRKLETSDVPIRMRAGSNPGGRGHNWVKKRFVNDDSPQPFIQSSYTDNIYLDKQYGHQLDKLSPLLKAQLKYGDWDAKLSTGLLVNRESLEAQLINPKVYLEWIPSFCTIGVDPASTGSDHFAMTCLVYFSNGKYVVVDIDSTPSSNPESLLKNFIVRNQRWRPAVVNFEREAGSSPEYALKYWTDTLRDEMSRYGFQLKDTTASSTGSKYMRAMPHSQLVRDGRLYFNELLLTDMRDDFIPLQNLFNQYVYVHPDKGVMKEYASPDELDSLGYAFSEMQEVLRYNGTGIRMGGRI